MEISRPPRGARTIQSQLLALAIGIIVVTILVTTVVGYDLASNVIRQAQQTSSESLREQAEAYLIQINNTIASQNNLILDRAAKDVKAVADVTAAIYNGDLPSDYWKGEDQDEALTIGPEGQRLNGLEDISSIFVPNTQADSPALMRDLELSAYLDLVLPAIKENNPNAAAIFFGSENDLTRYYPNILLGEIVPADFQVTQRPWYLSSLSENTGRIRPVPVWSPVYQDATGLGLVTTIAMPAYDSSGLLLGVIGLDLTLGEISKNIETTRFLESGYSFLVDRDGKAIVLPDQGYQDLLGRPPAAVGVEQADEFAPDMNLAPDVTFANLIGRMRAGESGFESLRVGENELFIAYSPLESTGWSLGSVVPAEAVLQSVAALEQDLQQVTRTVIFQRVLPIGLLISTGLLLIALLLTNRLVNPIQKLAQAAEQIGAGERTAIDHLAQIPVHRDDEIGFLSRTLSQMAGQIQLSFEQLEQRVTERTQQLEKRTLQLQTAAEVARDITTAPDLDTLLQSAVDLISSRFGYYNVGIFLLDESSEFAHLRAASGDLGKKLLERKIQLRVGQQGIVGYVTQFAQARIVGDVQADEAYQAEPLLADSRSEAAIPLLSGRLSQAGGQSDSGSAPRAVIGALDVQSTELNAFSENDIVALQVLADQMAIAIQNIRLVTRLQSTLAELNLFNQRQAKDAWKGFAHQTGGLAYIYDRTEVKPESIHSDPFAKSKATLIPIRLREQVIGMIGLESDDPDHQWSEDELVVLQAVAEQAALTVENARLLAESQQKAAREQLSGEMTARIRASLDMETVIRTAMNEIAQRIGVSQVEVQLGTTTSSPETRGDGHHGGS